MSESISANVLPFDKRAPAFERRRHERLRAPNIQPRPGGDRLEILDLSQRGMAIESLHPFSVGGNYLFELLDQGRALMIEGRICWSRRIAAPFDSSELEPGATFQSGIAFVGVQSRAAESAPPEIATLSSVTPDLDDDAEQLMADRLRRLQTSEDPDQSAEALLDLLSADFEHLVLFRIRGEEIHAWLGRGPTLVPERLLKLRLRLDQASIFLHLRQGGSFFYGQLPAMFAHVQLLRCWNGSLQRECALFPVRLKNRLVAVLYADAGDRPLEPEHLRILNATTDLMTQSLIDQILRRKRRARQSSEES